MPVARIAESDALLASCDAAGRGAMTALAAAAAEDGRRRVLLGIACTTLAYALFTGHDTLIKLLTETQTVWQIMFFRSLTIVLATLVAGRGPLLRRARITPYRNQLLLRGCLILAAWLCFYNAARYLQLAELTTIYFATPVLVTLLAVPLLGERIGQGRWIPVALGFVGVVVASGLANFSLTWPAGLAFLAAIFWSWATILIRRIALSETTLVQMLYSNGFFVVVCGVVLTFEWRTPDGRELVLLLAVGAIGGLAQFCMFEGLRRAPASVLAPFQYSSLLWAFLLGWLVWADWPRDEVFLGALLILASGALAVWQQRRPQLT
jgi:drug/metabolite transporter (DMT)-like permease